MLRAAGCKQNNVSIVYTMWSNLRKSGDMDVGQVGFHKPKEVRRTLIEKKCNETINRCGSTREWRHRAVPWRTLWSLYKSVCKSLSGHSPVTLRSLSSLSPVSL